MGLNPNVMAVVASLVLGVLVILWNATLKRLTGAELMVIIGLVYLAFGGLQLIAGGLKAFSSPEGVRIGLVTALVYASSFLLLNRVFGHPQVNLPVATAITAAYPAITALLGLLFLGSSFSPQQTLFFAMTVGGVVGLSLTGK